ncbi:uncharacterized protein LOC126681481 [Mercurialis annua]|uniref:uncharacterized protein LOC126681481 n=1 Tax=Mercurialis annua TaxID=3986 RepID=UPI002160AC94|nr:uncharacterized protein LOC126681481 [Mercurialis annua]
MFSSNDIIDKIVVSTWLPPPANAFKISFDGAYLKDSQVGVGACVMRNSQGRAVFSIAKRFHNVSSPAIIEALALRESIQLAARTQTLNPYFEGDAKSIIDVVLSSKPVELNCDVILQNYRSLCGELGFTNFSFVRRNCNWAVHE